MFVSLLGTDLNFALVYINPANGKISVQPHTTLKQSGSRKAVQWFRYYFLSPRTVYLMYNGLCRNLVPQTITFTMTYRVFQKKQFDLFVLYQNGKKHMKKEGELSVINISVVCNLFIVYRRQRRSKWELLLNWFPSVSMHNTKFPNDFSSDFSEINW